MTVPEASMRTGFDRLTKLFFDSKGTDGEPYSKDKTLSVRRVSACALLPVLPLSKYSLRLQFRNHGLYA